MCAWYCYFLFNQFGLFNRNKDLEAWDEQTRELIGRYLGSQTLWACMCTPCRGIKGLSGGLPADIDEFFYKHSVMHAYTFIHTIHTCANLAVYEAECVVILLPTTYTQVMSAGFVWDGASNLPGPGARSQEPGTCENFRTGTRRLWLKSKHQAHTCSFKKKMSMDR